MPTMTLVCNSGNAFKWCIPKPFLLALMFLFALNKSVMSLEKSEESVAYSFNHLKMETVRKKKYKVSKLIKYGAFPVPVENAIGTNNHTRLEPHNEKMDTGKVWSTNPTSVNVIGHDKLYHWKIKETDN